MDDDTRSVASSEINVERTRRPFTQEQVDALRGFLDTSKEIADLRKRVKEAGENLKKHREVLVNLLKERKKSRLVIDPETKIHFQQAIVKKKPTGKQLRALLDTALLNEGADVRARITLRLETTLKEAETVVQKEQLSLKREGETAAGGGRKKKPTSPPAVTEEEDEA